MARARDRHRERGEHRAAVSVLGGAPSLPALLALAALGGGAVGCDRGRPRAVDRLDARAANVAELRTGPPEGSSVATATRAEAPIVYRSHHAMGTQIAFTACTDDERRALDAFDAGFREIERLEALLTVWSDSSDVSRINAAAGRAPIAVSKDTLEVLERAKEASALTEGKFDVTFGALSGLWRFDHDQNGEVPSPEEVKKRIRLIDYRSLIVDRARGTAFLKRRGMKIHLGGIGKGFAVDHVVAIFRERGLRDFMVQAGGDLFVSGTRGARAWRVGIRDPRGPPDRYFAAAEVTDATFSTSGDYERSFFKNGRRYHHILDPATGAPAMRTRAVTIMALDATTAEGLSKAVFILGPQAGLRLIEKVPGAGAVIVDAKNQVHISERLRGKVRILFPPTDAP